MNSSAMHIQSFFEPVTGTVSYVVADTVAGQAAVIDPVLDFDARSGRLGTASSDVLIDYVRQQGWQVPWILETHAHADHLSGAQHVRKTLGGQVAIGQHIRQVQQMFRSIFHFERSFLPDGSQFDVLLADGQELAIGSLTLRALHVPGHTPADMAYQVEDAVFVGDTLFMPDVGTARADFPGGDAATLYRSIQRMYTLPDATRVFVCHDYGPGGRDFRCQTSIGEQKRANVHVRADTPEAEFVGKRETRDATLEMPRLILPSVQVNIRAGALPPREDNGVRYLKIPLDTL